ncbi:srs domain-containing protein, partial [Cystoisospora suis]
MSSLRLCYQGLPLSSAGGRGRMARQYLWLLACAAAVILLSSSAYALRQQGRDDLRAKELPAGSKDVEEATCPSGEVKEFTATLSESKPKVSLQCAAAADEVVPKLLEGRVCPEGVKDLAACKTAADDGSEDKAVSLAVLMGGAAETPVKWVEVTPAQRETAKKYELSLPKTPLPLLDST